MEIKELKSKIENKTIDDRFMIWVIDNDYSMIIANQYLHKLSDIWNLNIKYIDSINDIPDKSFIEDDNLYVINIDTWNNDLSHDNCIVICNKCKNGIKFPKLQDWQLVDYSLSFLKGLDKQDIEWLITQYNGNYFRFLNDIEKISIFDTGSQKLVFNKLLDDHQFDSITSLNVWDLSNAIIKKDIRLIKEVLKVIDYIDVTPLGLSAILLNNFRNILIIQSNPRCTGSDLGISDKQFFVIKKYNTGFYTEDQLVKILDMLTNVEYLYKYDGISMSSLIDYMICIIMGV